MLVDSHSNPGSPNLRRDSTTLASTPENTTAASNYLSESKAALPTSLINDTVLNGSFFPQLPQSVDSIKTPLNEQQTEITRKESKQDAKKKALFSTSCKQMASELQEFQASQALFVKRISILQDMPEIAAYLAEVPAFTEFYQRVNDILLSKEKVLKKAEALATLYAGPQAGKPLKFIEKHTPVLKTHFEHDPFVVALQLQPLAHYFFLCRLETYTTIRLTQNYQTALQRLAPSFLKSCTAIYHDALKIAASRLSTYLQQQVDETIPYEEARTTLIAHYGNRVVNELAFDFPIESTITIVRFKEMLLAEALRIKKEDLVALYQAIKGCGGYDLFACQRNMDIESIQQLQNTNSFQELNYKQLDCLVSAFRSYTLCNGKATETNARLATHAKQNAPQPIGHLIEKIYYYPLAPITKVAGNFLQSQKTACNYIQIDEDSVEAKYAPREYLAREIVPYLNFENIEKVIFKSLTLQNTLSYSYVAASLSDKEMHAYMVFPLINNPKETLVSLLFGESKHYGVSDDSMRLKTRSVIFEQLKDDLWQLFVQNLPNSEHIAVDVVGYKLGAYDTMMFVKQFAIRYYSQASPWHVVADEQDAIELEMQPEEEPTNLTNIKLLQMWALVPHMDLLTDCKEYNYRRSLLQELPEEKRPIIAHNYLQYLHLPDSSPQKYTGLYGWVDPNRPDDWYGQSPAKTWSYKNKDGEELSVQDTCLLFATPIEMNSSIPTIFSPRSTCTRRDRTLMYFNVIPPEKVNQYLGQSSLVDIIVNGAFSLVKSNVWDNLALPETLSSIVSKSYSYISRSEETPPKS